MKTLCSHSHALLIGIMFLLLRMVFLTSKQGLAILPYLACQKLRQALEGVVTILFSTGVGSFAFELTPSMAPRDIKSL